MKSVTKYVCEKCGTEFEEESKATACEAAHKTIKSTAPVYTRANAEYPTKVTVTFSDDTVATYKEG